MTRGYTKGISWERGIRLPQGAGNDFIQTGARELGESKLIQFFSNPSAHRPSPCELGHSSAWRSWTSNPMAHGPGKAWSVACWDPQLCPAEGISSVSCTEQKRTRNGKAHLSDERSLSNSSPSNYIFWYVQDLRVRFQSCFWHPIFSQAPLCRTFGVFQSMGSE